MNELQPRSAAPSHDGDAAAAPPVLRSTLTATPGELPGEGVPLAQYASALRRHLWLVVLSAVVSVATVAWRQHGDVPVYATSASVALSDAKQALSGSISNGRTEGLEGYYTDPVLSQIQLLKSRAVAGAVVDSLGLRLAAVKPADFPWALLSGVRVGEGVPDGDTLTLAFDRAGVTGRFLGATAHAAYRQPLSVAGITMTVRSRPPVDAAAFALAPREDVVNGVLGALQARPRELTNVIDIGYSAPDPVLAQRVVNTTAEVYRDLNALRARQQSHRRRLFVEEQLKSTDSLLVVAQYSLSAFRKGVQAFSPREKFSATQSGIANLRLSRQQLEVEMRIYKQMAERLEGAGSGGNADQALAALASSPQLDNSGVRGLYEQFVHYQTMHDSATAGYATSLRNPDLQRIDTLRAAARNRLNAAVEARSIGLQAQLAAIDQLMAADASSISALPDAEAEEMRLSRQVETLQKLVDDLLLEKQKARIDEAVEQGQVEIVDRALVPGAPIGRGAYQKLLFALLVGLAIGAGGALGLDRLNNTITGREDLEGTLRIPALGVIPRMDGVEPVRRGGGLMARGVTRRLPRPADAGGGDAAAEKEGTSELVTISDLHSSGSQAYRKLRTHLLFSQGGPRLKTILVTSAAASEGKSTVSSNLAVTFAQQDMRVLLMDCDLRRSRLHEVFGLRRVPGLPEVLGGQVALEDAVRATAVEGLSLLPAGRLTPNATELLGGAGMQQLLERVAEMFDVVVIDTPPVMAAADAEVLGVQADAVVLVVRAGQTERQSAQYAVQQLRAIGARVVGAVLNDPDSKIPNYGRYAYYYDYYKDA